MNIHIKNTSAKKFEFLALVNQEIKNVLEVSFFYFLKLGKNMEFVKVILLFFQLTSESYINFNKGGYHGK